MWSSLLLSLGLIGERKTAAADKDSGAHKGEVYIRTCGEAGGSMSLTIRLVYGLLISRVYSACRRVREHTVLLGICVSDGLFCCVGGVDQMSWNSDMPGKAEFVWQLNGRLVRAL